jgi:hypothetical protein
MSQIPDITRVQFLDGAGIFVLVSSLLGRFGDLQLQKPLSVRKCQLKPLIRMYLLDTGKPQNIKKYLENTLSLPNFLLQVQSINSLMFT